MDDQFNNRCMLESHFRSLNSVFKITVGMPDAKCGKGLQDFWSANCAVNTL